MAETWLFNNPPEGACLSFDEVVRVELGPQVIGLTVNRENLSDLVTHPKYHIGARDAYGRIIGKEIPEGGTMYVVDWRAKWVPKLWKVYVWRDRNPSLIVPQERGFGWVKVAEYPDFNEARDHARRLRKEMTSDAIHY